jgi:TPP-dependent pyruvate/acetoin dehydrogenase alpha subunit
LVYPLEPKALEHIYRKMVLIRQVELGIARRYNQGLMRCPTHLSVGQEVTPAVISAFTNENDYAVSTHRSHAHYLAKGGNLVAMLAEIYGLERGCSKGRGGSMHLADKSVRFMGSSAIVGNSIPVGTGLGMAAKLEGSDSISLVYLGDAAVEEGAFYESANFAAVAQLPVLYVCENNGFSVYTGFEERQPAGREIHSMVSGLGIESQRVSSYEFPGFVNSIQGAIDKIRLTRKPFFLEVETDRYLEHCGPNDDSALGYRDVEQLEQIKSQDPLDAVAKRLSDLSLEVQGIFIEVDSFVERAFSEVEQMYKESSPVGRG